MRILLNDTEYVIPSSLSEFTLGQRIDFYNQHGKELEEMYKSILEIKDETEKEFETAEFQFELMFRTFSFFTGVDIEVLKESAFVDQIASIYFSSLHCLFEEEHELQPRTEFEWNGDVWELHPHELKHGSKMTFGEFIDAKQTVKDLLELGKGKWEYMLPLCAIYLRKKGEAYQKDFLFEDSERLDLMKSLPMDIALQVGFFLTGSMNMYLNTFRFSSLPGLKTADGFPNSTLIAGAGSTS